jgi:hypothetical protein
MVIKQLLDMGGCIKNPSCLENSSVSGGLNIVLTSSPKLISGQAHAKIPLSLKVQGDPVEMPTKQRDVTYLAYVKFKHRGALHNTAYVSHMLRLREAKYNQVGKFNGTVPHR